MKDSKTLLNEHLFPTKYCLRLLDCKHLFSSLPPSPLGGIPSLSNPVTKTPSGVRRGGKRGRKRIRGNLWVSPPTPVFFPHTFYPTPPHLNPFSVRFIGLSFFSSGKVDVCCYTKRAIASSISLTPARDRAVKKRVDITLLTPIFLVFVRGKRRCARHALFPPSSPDTSAFIHGVCY